jgi:hypothetical protein
MYLNVKRRGGALNWLEQLSPRDLPLFLQTLLTKYADLWL